MLWRERVRRGLTLADGSVPIGDDAVPAWAAETAAPADLADDAAGRDAAEAQRGAREAEADEAARQEAWRQGYESGKHDAAEALEPLAEALRNGLGNLSEARRDLEVGAKEALQQRLAAAAKALAEGSRLEAVEKAARSLAAQLGRNAADAGMQLACDPGLAGPLAERLAGVEGLQVVPKAGLGRSVVVTQGGLQFECLPGDLERLAVAAARGDEIPAAFHAVGTVVRTRGPLLEAEGVRMSLGDLAEVGEGPDPLLAEAVGFDGGKALLSPLGELRGLGPGARVAGLGRPVDVPVGRGLLGHVLDAMGRPMDGRSLPEGLARACVHPLAGQRDPLAMARITSPFHTGVTALDGFLSCGVGQRLGIFSGSGVGKSTLLGMLARRCEADVVVIGLIGERGREVRDFLERDLGDEGRARSVVVVSTSEQPPALRVQAALTATAIAENFRAEGLRVLLLMDSVTRFAQSLREIGLSLGEPPATRGYPPSVYAALPRLLERSGALEAGGSITAFYTVLVEGDDMNEPVADTVRGILDGHVILSRSIAEGGRYPAVDVLASLSRCMPEVVSPEHLALAQRGRRLLSALDAIKDLLSVGAYREGADPMADEARKICPALEDLLRQAPSDLRSFSGTTDNLRTLLQGAA
jgi:flagellum-specific ATP synthase